MGQGQNFISKTEMTVNESKKFSQTDSRAFFFRPPTFAIVPTTKKAWNRLRNKIISTIVLVFGSIEHPGSNK